MAISFVASRLGIEHTKDAVEGVLLSNQQDTARKLEIVDVMLKDRLTVILDDLHVVTRIRKPGAIIRARISIFLLFLFAVAVVGQGMGWLEFDDILLGALLAQLGTAITFHFDKEKDDN